MKDLVVNFQNMENKKHGLSESTRKLISKNSRNCCFMLYGKDALLNEIGEQLPWDANLNFRENFIDVKGRTAPMGEGISKTLSFKYEEFHKYVTVRLEPENKNQANVLMNLLNKRSIEYKWK